MTVGVYLNGERKHTSKDTRSAQAWAEYAYGSKQDGICIDGVEIKEDKDA